MEATFLYILLVTGSVITTEDPRIMPWSMLAHPSINGGISSKVHSKESCEKTKEQLPNHPYWRRAFNDPDFDVIAVCVPFQERQPSEALQKRLKKILEQDAL